MSAIRPIPTAGGTGTRGDSLALIGLVRETVAAGVARQVLYLRLSDLGPRLNRAHHHRLLREALEPLLRPSRGRIFELPNGDLLAVAPPGSAHLSGAEAALATLLAADAAAAATAPPYAMLRLPQEVAALLAAVEAALHPAGSPEPAGGEAGGGCFGTGDLAALARALGGASLASFLRHQPVFRLAPGSDAPELAWEEWRIALPELCAALRPGADPEGAPWLLRRLRGLLDRRLLAGLARPEEARQMGPVGLALGLDSLASPDFLRLDEALGAAGRAAGVIGLPPAELLADPEGFVFAREFCRARGWRLALDGVEAAQLPLLAPLEKLGLDLLRLRWSPDLVRLEAALPADRACVILAGADSAAAIGWGWEAGIGHFQGRMLRMAART
jgi:hypothetical protein